MEREVLKIQDESKSFFKNIKQSISCQYDKIYQVRSSSLRPKLKMKAMSLWSLQDHEIVELSNIKRDVECCIIGIIFKEMKLQPSILKEVSDEFKFDAKECELNNFTSEEDSLILEDGSQRITLTGNVDVGQFYTGTMVAFYGKEESSGMFNVEKYTYAGFPPQKSIKIESDTDKYVLIVSGLNIGKQANLELQLLFDFISGLMDCKFASQVSHLIVAGNNVSKIVLDKENKSSETDMSYEKAIKGLDEVISQLLPDISVDLMPGENDLGSYIMPQKPLHPSMFPLSRKHLNKNFRLASNPYKCSVNGVDFLGTSGQNITNMSCYSKMESIKILEDTLRAQHIAPTAPDTLGCYPFTEKDPFIIEECPHVYFAGNQEKYEHAVKTECDGQKVDLICVPDFTITKSAVLYNLSDQSVQELNISCFL